MKFFIATIALFAISVSAYFIEVITNFSFFEGFGLTALGLLVMKEVSEWCEE